MRFWPNCWNYYFTLKYLGTGVIYVKEDNTNTLFFSITDVSVTEECSGCDRG